MALYADLRNPDYDNDNADDSALLLTVTREDGSILIQDEPTDLVAATTTSQQLEDLRVVLEFRFESEVMTKPTQHQINDIMAAAEIRREMDMAIYEAAMKNPDPAVQAKLEAARAAGRKAAREDGCEECAYPTIEEEMAYISGYSEPQE